MTSGGLQMPYVGSAVQSAANCPIQFATYVYLAFLSTLYLSEKVQCKPETVKVKISKNVYYAAINAPCHYKQNEMVITNWWLKLFSNMNQNNM